MSVIESYYDNLIDQKLAIIDSVIEDQIRWNSLTDIQKKAIRDYRDELKSIKQQQPDYPNSVIFPVIEVSDELNNVYQSIEEI